MYGDAFVIDSDNAISESHLIEGASIHEDHHIDTEAHKEHHDDEDHSESSSCEDECHFCICLCNAHNILPSIIEISTIELENVDSKIDTNYTSLYSNSYLDRIFQPPQV